jgi:tRNA1(Val) A37 N6-methylase TrmN6
MTSYINTLFLYQPQNGYCYNSDTHFLYNFIQINLAHYKNIQGELLDIGSGSGILGLLVARNYKKLNLSQCEIQNSFQFLSQKNSEINGIQNTLYKESFIQCDFNKEFDYIVSNPPFYHSDVIKSENENLKIARYCDSLPLVTLLSKATKLLKPQGKFFFCYDAKQLDNILFIAKENKLNIESIQFLHPNSNKEASLVMIMGRKNSKSKLKILPPLIMFKKNGEFQEKINLIYKNCNTYSIKCEI